MLVHRGLRRIVKKLSRGRRFREWSYALWIRRYDRLTERDRELIRGRIASLPIRPTFTVMLRSGSDAPSSRRSVRSLLRQCYVDWELFLIAGDPSSMLGSSQDVWNSDQRIRVAGADEARRLASGPFVSFLDAGDELATQALYLVAEELSSHPDADLVYSDEDRIDPHGRRRDPWFKGDWDPVLLRSQNYIGGLAVYRTTTIAGAMAESGELADDHELALRFAETGTAARVRHVPHVLCHRPAGRENARGVGHARLERHLARCGINANVENDARTGLPRVRFPVPDEPPLVSIIVPTRDQTELLRVCAESILNGTRYPHFELIIVDNRSTEPATLRLFDTLRRDERVRVMPYDAPFDFAAMNNWAARQTKGELLAFVNNDVEVISPDWLSEMVSHALEHDVGAVGAKLYYPDQTIQHAGVVLGIAGIAGHGHHLFPRETRGDHDRAVVVQSFSAVTAACMVLRREVFEEVGGFDADAFRVAFNDIDLCLRIGKAGYRVVWTPFAELYHHESASLGPPRSRERRERFEHESRLLRERWGSVIEHDPAYNPNLSLKAGDFSLAFPPRATKPWL